jgi:magnesium transporter
MTMNDELKKTVLNEFELEALISEWATLPRTAHEETFMKLDRAQAEDLFLSVPTADQAELFAFLRPEDRRSWLRLLPPDDAADLIQHLPLEERPLALPLLDSQTRIEVSALLAYKEDQAGGLMNSRYARLRPEMTVEEAIRYLREQTRSQVETIYYGYVLDQRQTLLGTVSLRQLFSAAPASVVSKIMTTGDDLISVGENQDQEDIARLFVKNQLLALPVVNGAGQMKGIVTYDDVSKVLEQEATEDMQKIGGMEALDVPYFKIGFLRMVRKRAGWLLILFIGEMFTATAMGYYEKEIAKAVVLALFIPLIISSGGNSGSQASTLVIRSLALGEIRLRDWWRVLLRETASGLALGTILGAVGLARIIFWPARGSLYGVHYDLIAMAVGFSLVGIVLWGTLAGSMLPFALRRLGFDPATASAPFVATLVDVTGLVIYFSMAQFILGGSIL